MDQFTPNDLHGPVTATHSDNSDHVLERSQYALTSIDHLLTVCISVGMINASIRAIRYTILFRRVIKMCSGIKICGAALLEHALG